MSPETAAYSALFGVIKDPRECDVDLSSIDPVSAQMVDDSMFIFPENAKKEKVKRGPNIGEPPSSESLSDSLSGSLWLKVGDKITTDHIMPAGQFLKYRSNIPKYATFVFYPVDENFSKRALEKKKEGESGFIVAGSSYGQGSSREHAAICPMYLGVRAVIAVSIERIHQANLCNFGILPLLFKNEKDYAKVDEGDRLRLSNIYSSIDSSDFVLIDETKGIEIPLVLFASEVQKQMLKKGGRLNQIKEALND